MDSFVDFLITQIDVYKVLYLLDPPTAQKFKAHSHEVHHDHECSHVHHESTSYAVPIRADMSQLERTLAEMTNRSSLYELLPAFVTNTSRIYENVTRKGQEDGLTLDTDTEKQLTKEVIVESLQRTLVEEVNRRYRREDNTESRQPLLLAHPSGYKETANADLNLLESETLATLMASDWAYQDSFFPV